MIKKDNRFGQYPKGMWRCCKCVKIKKLENFGYRKYTIKDGTQKTKPSPICKTCAVIYSIEWREKNRERYDEYHRERWRQKALLTKAK